jgi:dynein heavy chain
MQRPAEMTWSNPKCVGAAPSKRSGHSISIVGDQLYMFGGNDFRRPPGPNNDLYKLDMSSSEYFWSKIEPAAGAKWPEARSHHTAVVFEDGGASPKIIIFGGFRSSSIRYNDVWILDTATDSWEQPRAGLTETKSDGSVHFKSPWQDVPLPRGAHSACIVNGSQMYIFGGYGGMGFARRDFNDIHVLDLGIWEWRVVETVGELLPPPRSGHKGLAVLENIYVIGGWNAEVQFNDMWVFNTVSGEWTQSEENTMGAAFGQPRWKLCCRVSLRRATLEDLRIRWQHG